MRPHRLAGDSKCHIETVLLLRLEENGGPVGEVRTKGYLIHKFTTCDLINAGCIKKAYLNEFCDRVCMSIPYPKTELLSVKFRNLSKPISPI